MTNISEFVVEEAVLAWLAGLGWSIKHGPEIAPGELFAERTDYSQVILEDRLRQAIARFNPELPDEVLEECFRKLTRPEGSTLEARNRAFHRALVDGITVEYRTEEGCIRGAQARVVDFDAPDNNDWLAVNRFTVYENKIIRRPDVVLFLNGLPLAVLELKNPGDENATIWTGYRQLQTYKNELPTFFGMNEMLVVSDGVGARVGTMTVGREWFKPWRTILGEQLADARLPELQVVVQGMFEKRRFLDLVRDNVTIDWTLRENVRAQLRVLIKRILRKHGYPPDKQEKATQTVLEQAEVLSGTWAVDSTAEWRGEQDVNP